MKKSNSMTASNERTSEAFYTFKMFNVTLNRVMGDENAFYTNKQIKWYAAAYREQGIPFSVSLLTEAGNRLDVTSDF